MNETLPLDDETDLSRPWTAAEGISRGVCRLLTRALVSNGRYFLATLNAAQQVAQGVSF